jgi:hypothetical protein
MNEDVRKDYMVEEAKRREEAAEKAKKLHEE